MIAPEQQARAIIDELLAAAGWVVQDRGGVNLGAAVGVAVREFPLTTGEADYLLFVQRKAIGAVEAKPEGATLSGVEAQSGKYSVGLPAQVPAWRRPESGARGPAATGGAQARVRGAVGGAGRRWRCC